MAEYTSYPDEKLLVLLKQGNHAAYAEIYHRYKYVLQSHAYKKLGDFEEAKDVLQEVFTTLWTKRESLLITSNLSGYLYNAVRNHIFNLLAHKKVSTKYLESLQNYLNEGHNDTENHIIEHEFAEEINREIDALPARMREIFILSRKKGLSHKEIADQLQLSEQTVSKQVSNALTILRKKLRFLLFFLVLHMASLLYFHL
ncbi:RNA polymerase sigma-70 factor, ECF subfamily [bacterium A37T11]|nr:RNA polymerase sigma-70 factor, ECF subfamily [bacterium A37T11]